LHHLALVVQRAVSTLIEEEFYSSFTPVIGYLLLQMIFVANCKANFPLVLTTRYLSLGNVSARVVRNVIEEHAHISERQPACAPSPQLWATLDAVNTVMEDVAPVFVDLNGITTLVSDQKGDSRRFEIRSGIQLERRGSFYLPSPTIVSCQ
jgi:hypothetical protein